MCPIEWSDSWPWTVGSSQSEKRKVKSGKRTDNSTSNLELQTSNFELKTSLLVENRKLKTVS
jgi:hypothetical protein